jgi:hypothetical protein
LRKFNRTGVPGNPNESRNELSMYLRYDVGIASGRVVNAMNVGGRAEGCVM